MVRGWFAAIAIGAALLIAAGSLIIGKRGTWSFWVGRDAGIGICSANDEIPQGERRAMESAASEFLRTVNETPQNARSLMSKLWAETFRPGEMQPFIDQMRSAPAINRTAGDFYFMQFVPGSRDGAVVPCNFHGQPGRPDFPKRGMSFKSGIVQFADTLIGGNERMVSVWMEHERGAWRVRAVRLNVSRLNGWDAAGLWDLARAQRESGHGLNAALLYGATITLLDPQGFVQPEIAQYFWADQRTLAPLAELQGPFPLLWEFNGRQYEVMGLQYHAVSEGYPLLLINHKLTAWSNEAEVEQANRALIDGFDRRHPEWREVFGGLAARASRTDSNELWGTVFLREGGYDRPGSALTTPPTSP